MLKPSEPVDPFVSAAMIPALILVQWSGIAWSGQGSGCVSHAATSERAADEVEV